MRDVFLERSGRLQQPHKLVGIAVKLQRPLVFLGLLWSVALLGCGSIVRNGIVVVVVVVVVVRRHRSMAATKNA
jgi:hypothetical protein